MPTTVSIHLCHGIAKQCAYYQLNLVETTNDSPIPSFSFTKVNAELKASIRDERDNNDKASSIEAYQSYKNSISNKLNILKVLEQVTDRSNI